MRKRGSEGERDVCGLQLFFFFFQPLDKTHNPFFYFFLGCTTHMQKHRRGDRRTNTQSRHVTLKKKTQKNNRNRHQTFPENLQPHLHFTHTYAGMSPGRRRRSSRAALDWITADGRHLRVSTAKPASGRATNASHSHRRHTLDMLVRTGRRPVTASTTVIEDERFLPCNRVQLCRMTLLMLFGCGTGCR